ncbi:3-ketoacyl-CoA thiolase, mitochondrial-like [Schistocerca piceifrons]|uniref:3-ketoacyl-CoA thiolase, mitochondrial-like n=1 Tax=Schistocerca piceifrons TaxID=274613 RepID=UPI001F5E4DA7|nr:3-ketoacyl-CoA thiolase, mitochondrial-like [Schistocerca piceifrons]XP_049784991.1 3-ketoacyl-CoA thiolase, mitochondrial-like [Schistocerca cancellata]XP_049812629.1 3-ketoacyl-CoA thiolase, mitochondrial-like [Schistocerca nitens]XP_049828367.1 3-ketoacyl-CoA thiolase, mitochondrial-like [Schistocerca gregaria]
MAALTKGIFIVAAKRTPFGTMGGKFVQKSAMELQEVAGRAALAAGRVSPDQVDSVVIGNVLSVSAPDSIFIARHVSLRCGIPIERPALAVNRLCGSGFQAIVSGAHNILVGDSKVVLTGGTDNMSQAPYAVRNIRFGAPLGARIEFEDTLWVGLTDTYCNLSMALTAENLAEKYKIARQDVDKYSLRSQMQWKNANDKGYFKEELAPVTLTIKKKEVIVDVDEHPRPQTTAEGLAKLAPVFKKNGVVTAGSASGICDGAGAVVLASEEACKEYGYKPLARLVGYSVVGVDPSIMGIGPAPAIQKLLKVTDKTLNDIDLVEINEAFAAQTLSCQQELKLDMEKLNVNGGAIALGHPLAASGSRITSHLVHELRRRKGKYGIGSACIGGGQGIALLVESIH